MKRKSKKIIYIYNSKVYICQQNLKYDIKNIKYGVGGVKI